VADPTQDCKIFDGWTVTADCASEWTGTMPACDVSLTSSFTDDPACTEYTLTVVNGTGSIDATEGTETPISANTAPEGETFDTWTGDVEYVTDVNAESTTVTMPAQAVNVTATYKPIEGEGTTITIRARLLQNGPDEIELLLDDTSVKTWTVSSTSYSDFTHEVTGTHNVKVYFQDNAGNNPDVAIDYIQVGSTVYQAEDQATNTAVWQGQCGGSYSEQMHCPGYIDFGTINFGNNVPEYTLTVDGTVQGSYTEGATVTVTDPTQDCKIFDGWDVAASCISSWNGTMPACNVSLTSTFVDDPACNTDYVLNVESGSGSGIYSENQVVEITANAVSGQAFTSWTGDIGYLDDANDATTSVTMAAQSISVTATYTIDDPGNNTLPLTLQAEDGTLTGVYTETYDGRTYAIGFDQNGDNVTWNGVDVGAAGNYDITLLYQNLNDQEMKVIVNGTTYNELFPGLSWGWGEKVISNVPFNATGNTIVYEKGWGFTRLDYIVIEDDANKSVSLTNNVDNSGDFMLYPNPSTGNFTIDVFSGQGQVDIYTIEGQKVFSYELEGESLIEVQAGTLKTGMYLVKVNNSIQKLMIK